VNLSRLVSASAAIPLSHGDVLALLTDGIAEAESPDGVPFGSNGALDFIGGHAEASAQTIVDGLTSAVRAFHEGSAQRDDITMVVCKRVEHARALHALSA
jgi:serine phosphatase RsbU (regulator of sigma subunit)